MLEGLSLSLFATLFVCQDKVDEKKKLELSLAEIQQKIKQYVYISDKQQPLHVSLSHALFILFTPSLSPSLFL